jgi:hypothetical protein
MRGAYEEAYTTKGATAARHMVGEGRIRMRSSLGAQIGACTALGRRIYMAFLPLLKSPSLLYMDFFLEPTKCFAWDFGGQVTWPFRLWKGSFC